MLLARRPSTFIFRDTLTLFASLGKADRDGLLAALHFTAFAAASAFRGTPLVPAHSLSTSLFELRANFVFFFFFAAIVNPPSNDIRFGNLEGRAPVPLSFRFL
jgi:hypothetical protein